MDRYGHETAQIPDQWLGRYDTPYHYGNFPNRNFGGPHDAHAAFADIDGGKMDGFITEAEWNRNDEFGPFEPDLSRLRQALDVLGYYDSSDVPNYWSYARNFVLQDHMFSPCAAGGLPAHLYLVSGWSAFSPDSEPMHSRNTIQGPNAPWRWHPLGGAKSRNERYAWTDITWLLHKNNVSWRYYFGPGTPEDWIPPHWFATVRDDGELDNVQPVSQFRKAAQAGTLPSVCWIVPGFDVSEHPRALVSAGEGYVTDLINAVMRSPEWNSTAILLAWDNWGGFYDHVVPPKVDADGYGLRVPGLVISPYAKKGYVDHQVLSLDAYLKFIEDRFLGGQRLDPATDGRPDPRPTVRENVSILGDLTNDFDFDQPPRPPMILK
jgi:phospholipase C